MKIDYQTVVNQSGDPQSVIISWEVFQQICDQLEVVHEEDDVTAEKPYVEGTDDPVQYKAGGDYQRLSEIGVNLPSNLKRRLVAEDGPAEQEEGEQAEEEHEVRIGKRIR